jgi:outer membrane protein OmpA-like peptidoglycan-associated protein
LLQKGIIMLSRVALKRALCFVLISGILTGCFNSSHHKPKSIAFNTNLCEKPLMYSRAEKAHVARRITKDLGAQSIQFIQRGDRITLIIPTDRYYIFNSPNLDDLKYPILDKVAELVNLFPCSRVTVASFSDNVGKRIIREKLTQARAQSMLSFLWAKGVPAQLLTAESFGSHLAVGDNQITHGSAYNRRIEIQWWTSKNPPAPAPKYDRMDMKMR